MQRRRPPRQLRPDEQMLWQEVARSTQPLSGRKPFGDKSARGVPQTQEPPASPPPAPAGPVRPPRATPQPAALRPFRIGERAPVGSPTAEAAAAQASPPLRMDARAFGRLSRGKLAPEARIDLHGLTLPEAQLALCRFVSGAHARGARLVLVITGKGRNGGADAPFSRRIGALRREVPLWLSRPPLSGIVLQVAEAHPRHGGAGALYVYLRKGG